MRIELRYKLTTFDIIFDIVWPSFSFFDVPTWNLDKGFSFWSSIWILIWTGRYTFDIFDIAWPTYFVFYV
jgi:hypothetical protein